MNKNKYGTYKFGLVTASAFVIANMIGTGVFTSLGFQLLGTTNFFSLMLLWLLGGIIALCGALVYGELGAVMPRSGGEYHYLREIYHPLLGFMSGWASLIVGFAAPVALACMALSTYLHKMFPAFDPLATAITVLTAVTLIHAYDVKMGGTCNGCLPSSRYSSSSSLLFAVFVCRLTDKSTVSLRQRSLSTMSFQQDLPCRSSGFITLIRAGTPQLTWLTKFANPNVPFPALCLSVRLLLPFCICCSTPCFCLPLRWRRCKDKWKWD
ncbi:amino acid permease family protein [Bacteroides graminisolvens DSM 19988 = JCM 15093]|uniref:Amino acid permease family protein n=1 Tax=Bacteroides graminisolvens DSM 19988 = JCM 15093 TaxID=1121097 RepID=A0A069D023_9BACE|nr:amino acid permease family protein [Bacteroides graminisolvens DSM 19988 = JCM 15093]